MEEVTPDQVSDISENQEQDVSSIYKRKLIDIDNREMMELKFDELEKNVDQTVTEINNRIDAISKDVDLNNTRIDNIINNTDVNTDAELVDIRLKIDGTIANSAGAAVREQIGFLYDEIKKISSSGGGSIAETYDGEYSIEPRAFEDQILQTQGKLMKEDLTVLEIPYYETSNTLGETIYIGKEVLIDGN